MARFRGQPPAIAQAVGARWRSWHTERDPERVRVELEELRDEARKHCEWADGPYRSACRQIERALDVALAAHAREPGRTVAELVPRLKFSGVRRWIMELVIEAERL